jgi:hypothetical protein
VSGVRCQVRGARFQIKGGDLRGRGFGASPRGNSYTKIKRNNYLTGHKDEQ